MTPDVDRFQRTLAQAQHLALAMPVSLFEVPSLYDLPRRVQRKPEPTSGKRAPSEEPIPATQRRPG